jgi:hypothetical protein
MGDWADPERRRWPFDGEGEVIEYIILWANAASTWFMAGVIAFVQIVQYPMFAQFAGPQFRMAMADHQRRTLFVVAGPMIVEGITSIMLLFCRPESVPLWAAWLGLVLVLVNTFSTGFLQVPCHERLERDGYDPVVHRRLVRTNLVRVAGWWGRSVMVLSWFT